MVAVQSLELSDMGKNEQSYEKLLGEPERKNYSIRALPYADWPLVAKKPISLKPRGDKDENGLSMQRKGESLYYHPGSLAQTGLLMLNSYLLTKKDEYLKFSILYAKKLLEISKEVDGSLFFGYSQCFNLHDFEDHVMQPPWYSAMDQGQALSLFVRLNLKAGITEFNIAADKTFRSLLSLRGINNPWVSLIDYNGYFWLIEYPSDHAFCNALNGFIFAILGIYEYFLLVQREDVKRWLQSAITTIERYVDEYRNPGGPSFYCLSHKVESKGYHGYHVDLLHKLYIITGEIYFEEKSLEFRTDYQMSRSFRFVERNYRKTRDFSKRFLNLN
jgi:hypothetical protein